jgi:hypothetical protein
LAVEIEDEPARRQRKAGLRQGPRNDGLHLWATERDQGRDVSIGLKDYMDSGLAAAHRERGALEVRGAMRETAFDP